MHTPYPTPTIPVRVLQHLTQLISLKVSAIPSTIAQAAEAAYKRVTHATLIFEGFCSVHAY